MATWRRHGGRAACSTSIRSAAAPASHLRRSSRASRRGVPAAADAVRILQALASAVDDSGTIAGGVPSFRRDVHQRTPWSRRSSASGLRPIPLTLAGGGEIMPVKRPPGCGGARQSRALNAAVVFACVTGASSSRTGSKHGLGRSRGPAHAPESLFDRALGPAPSLVPGSWSPRDQREPADAGRPALRGGQCLLAASAEDGDRPAHEDCGWASRDGLRAPRAWFTGPGSRDVYDAKGRPSWRSTPRA